MNYTQLQSRIKDYTEDEGTEFEASLPTIIENSERRIIRETDLDVFRKYAYVFLEIDNRYLNKPGDIVYDRWLRVLDTNEDPTEVKEVKPADPGLLRTLFPTEDTGLPRYYADWDDNTFLLAPPPDSTYRIELAYKYHPETLSDSNTTTWLSANAPDVLLYACLSEASLFLKIMPPQEQDMQTWEQMYTRALASLKKEQETWQRWEADRHGDR